MPKISKILIVVLIVGVVFGFGLSKGVAQPELPLLVKKEKPLKAPRPFYVPDEIIIKFKPGINENAIKGLEQAQGVLEKYISPFGKFRVLKIPQGKLVTEMVEIFKKSPLVEYADPNYYAYATMVPNDPYYPYQWHFDNQTYGGIQMEEAWNINTGTSSIVVAVIDTGVAYEDHPTDKYWHLDTYNAYSGHSWWCGVMSNQNWADPPGYSNYWDQYLTHQFDLTSATGDVTLSFRHKYDMESGYDYAYVEVSDDNGLTWSTLKSYTGNSHIWKRVRALDLTAYQDKTILLRFRFNSDYSYSDGDGDYNSDGAWYIDEVKITDDLGELFYDDMESGVGSWQVDSLPFQKAPDLANTNFISGYDFIDNDSHPNDDDSHGTHVAGTVAQSTNNNLGVAGIAFNTTIMPVKVLGPAGGTYQQVADGIYYATNYGADIINMSLGGPSPATVLEEACVYAYNNEVTVIAACGNDNDPTCDYPAAYDDYVIAIGATQYDETKAPYSNYGSSLDIVAPGGNTGVDQNGDGYVDGVLQQTFGNTLQDWDYYFFHGTSMSTPHTSGVAALLLAQDSNRTPAQIRSILQSTAEDKGTPGWDQYYGHGLLDAYAALTFTPVISISVIENSTFDYGTLALSSSSTTPTKKSTIELDKTPVVKNTGSVAVDLAVKSNDATGGTTLWDLVAAANIDQDKYCYQYSTDSGTNWPDFPISNNYTGTIITGLGVDATSTLDLQILMPTASTDAAEKSITVTIRATESGP